VQLKTLVSPPSQEEIPSVTPAQLNPTKTHPTKSEPSVAEDSQKSSPVQEEFQNVSITEHRVPLESPDQEEIMSVTQAQLNPTLTHQTMSRLELSVAQPETANSPNQEDLSVPKAQPSKTKQSVAADQTPSLLPGAQAAAPPLPPPPSPPCPQARPVKCKVLTLFLGLEVPTIVPDQVEILSVTPAKPTKYEPSVAEDTQKRSPLQEESQCVIISEHRVPLETPFSPPGQEEILSVTPAQLTPTNTQPSRPEPSVAVAEPIVTKAQPSKSEQSVAADQIPSLSPGAQSAAPPPPPPTLPTLPTGKTS
jgi:hypothetical protein